ncbi:MAG: hypothetical protein AAF361_06275, partial [Bacteroidota bacterium]
VPSFTPLESVPVIGIASTFLVVKVLDGIGYVGLLLTLQSVESYVSIIGADLSGIGGSWSACFQKASEQKCQS